MTKRYDDIVVGSGISGLTSALLMARNGRRVLLLEKAPRIGGSIARFARKGVPFDVGFHFTGGLHEGGILHGVLSLLGIRELIEPIFLPAENAAWFVFENERKRFEHPWGIDTIKKTFKGYFPGEASGIDRYFDMVQSVCDRTPSMNLQTNVLTAPSLDEDYISLDSVLRSLFGSDLLRGLLSGYVMLYGVKPAEISFANHSRMCQSFHESIACVKGGGDAFVKAFQEAFRGLDVDIRCGCAIAELADIAESRVGRFVLTSGEEVVAENCILTIHPKEIMKLLPRERVSKAFLSRVAGYEPSAGFFSVFAALGPGADDPYPGQTIVSLFPTSDVNAMLDPAYAGEQALVIIKMPEETAAGGVRSVHILEPSFVEHVAAWTDSRIGRRPKEYHAYKEQRVKSIMEHVYRSCPAYQGHLNVLEAASMLTFRDYLNSPDGSAYGIKQRIGQFNLVGKLPLRNLYAAGQSAILPGVIGSMMSALIVGRTVMGKERYGEFVAQALCS